MRVEISAALLENLVMFFADLGRKDSVEISNRADITGENARFLLKGLREAKNDASGVP